MKSTNDENPPTVTWRSEKHEHHRWRHVVTLGDRWYLVNKHVIICTATSVLLTKMFKNQKSSQHFPLLTIRFVKFLCPVRVPGNTDPRFINTRLFFFFSFLFYVTSLQSLSIDISTHETPLPEHFFRIKMFKKKNSPQKYLTVKNRGKRRFDKPS